MEVMLEPVEVIMESKAGKKLQCGVSWKSATKMMAQSTFLESLQTFPKDAINDETIEFLFPWLAAEDMNFESAKKVSSNIAGLCTWVKSMDLYTAIAKEVKPKMALVAAAEGKLRIAQNKLDRAQNQLDECQADLDRMTAQFDEAMAEKAKIQADADATNKRMDAANKLIGGLSGERVRWTADSEAFADEIRRLAGDVALACAFTSYAGPFNAEFRQLLLR